jgi:hypothetical protein
MANLQKTLDALQPYVIGIRYLDGLPVVDAVFKDDWTLPESNIIHRVKGNNDVNYYMLFSETEGIGLDELLSYVDVTIKTNIEKEKKHELLKERVNELKELFKRTPLTKLQRLKFSFSDEDLMPELNDLTLDEEILEEKDEILNIISQPPVTTDEDVKQVPTIEENLTDEEREILEEERRAENYKTYQQNQKNTSQLESIKKKVELPPRKTIEAELVNKNESCDCEPEEACIKCIDKKSL